MSRSSSSGLNYALCKKLWSICSQLPLLHQASSIDFRTSDFFPISCSPQGGVYGSSCNIFIIIVQCKRCRVTCMFMYGMYISCSPNMICRFSTVTRREAKNCLTSGLTSWREVIRCFLARFYLLHNGVNFYMTYY